MGHTWTSFSEACSLQVFFGLRLLKCVLCVCVIALSSELPTTYTPPRLFYDGRGQGSHVRGIDIGLPVVYTWFLVVHAGLPVVCAGFPNLSVLSFHKELFLQLFSAG